MGKNPFFRGGEPMIKNWDAPEFDDFIADDQSSSSDNSNNSESSDELERQCKQTVKAKKRLRRRVTRRSGPVESEDDEDEPDSGLAERKRRKRNKSFERFAGLVKKEIKGQRKYRTRNARSKRVLVRPASDSDNESKPRYTKKGNLDMVPTVLLDKLHIPRRFKSDKSIPLHEIEQFLRREADTKDSRSEESDEGDLEPAMEKRSTNLKHIVSSDESDIETKVAQSKRRANIEESDDDDDSDDKESSDSEPTGFLSKKRPTKKKVRVELSGSSESEEGLSDDFVVSDEEPSVKKERNNSASSDSSDDGTPKQNKSILSQLDPNLLSRLKNDNTMHIAPFHTVAKLFIMDHLNSKTIDKLFKSTPAEFVDSDIFRSALNTMDRNLDQAAASCQSGAWQHLFSDRLKVHPCLESSSLPRASWHCHLCGRRRKCRDQVLIWGFGYNRTTIRGLRDFSSVVTDEEKDKGLQAYEGPDGTEGVKATIGPTCMKRLELYHEIRHYKIQLYNDLREEVRHQVELPACTKMYEAAKKHKQRVVDPDLRPLADQLFSRLEKAFVQTSFTNFKRLLERARDIEQYLGHDFE